MLPSYRSIVAACALALAVCPAAADELVSGHFKSNGTFVEPYMRSDRDGIFSNNWSTKGNVNPYTGKPGTRVTPPNSNKPSSNSRPSYSSPPATSYSVAPSYSSPVPPVDDFAAREAARRSAEAARAAQLAADAKTYSDAKVQALATAKLNSDQRRRAFRAELESERSKVAADYDSRKAELIAEHEQNEPAAVESDKAELSLTYRELVERFNQEQIADDNRFKAEIERQRRQLKADSDASEARAVAIFGRGRDGATQLSPAEISEYLRRYDAIQRRIAEHNSTAWPDQTKSEMRAVAIVREELNRRIGQRLTRRDQRLLAMKSARDQELSRHIAKLESDFERAEGERFAADQERAERRFLAYVHGESIDRALEPEPVAFVRPVTSIQSSGSSALALTSVVGLCLLLVVGAILSARSKTIDFRKPPHKKG